MGARHAAKRHQDVGEEPTDHATLAAFLQQKKRANVMHLILRPITEQYCDHTVSKSVR
jgi:hypothetical protein